MVQMPAAWLGLDLRIWLYGWGLLLCLLLCVTWPPFSSPNIVTLYPKDLIISPVLWQKLDSWVICLQLQAESNE